MGSTTTIHLQPSSACDIRDMLIDLLDTREFTIKSYDDLYIKITGNMYNPKVNHLRYILDGLNIAHSISTQEE